MRKHRRQSRGCLGVRIGYKRALAVVGAAAIVLAACSGPPSDGVAGSAIVLPTPIPPAQAPTPNEAGRIVYEVPGVDTSKASVELTEVIFDTFGGGPLDLATASAEDRAGLLDAIPPIDDPEYIDPVSDPWLLPDDHVLGYVDSEGQAFASPHKILALHEIVNTVLDDQAVLISYCPLCESGVVFSRHLDIAGTQTELRFSNTSALFDNDLVMVDRQTGSYWFQVGGRAIVGALTDKELTVLPSTTTTWEQWRQLYPGTLVLSRDLGFGRDYTQNRFAGYATAVDQGRTPFPVNPAALGDRRLSPATRVIVVDSPTDSVAVAVTTEPSVASFELDALPAVVLGTEGASAAFVGLLDGQPVELTPGPDGFKDAISGTTFDLTGTSLNDRSIQLTPLPSRSSFWFAAVAAFPDVRVVS